jgi:hypothetical protein
MAVHDLTPEQRAVLDALVPVHERTGNPRKDWAAAVRVAMWRRQENTRLGAAAIAALRELGVTWRDLEKETDVPWATARRWHKRPPGTHEPPEITEPPPEIHPGSHEPPPEIHLGHAS